MKNILFILLASLLFVGCNKEAALTPSQEDEKILNEKWMLKQGTKIHNEELEKIYTSHKIITFYEFSEIDFDYEVKTSALVNWKYEKADENYVDEQLSLINDLFLNLVGDDAINKFMPRKLLLVSSLRNIVNNIPEKQYLKDSYFSLTSFVIANANEEITKFDKARKEAFKDDLICEFVVGAYTKGFIKIPSDFLISDYKKINESNYKELGFIDVKSSNVDADFKNYIIMAISKSTAQLNAADGELSPLFDTHGLIRKKYDALLTGMKTIGIDIQKIANYEIK